MSVKTPNATIERGAYSAIVYKDGDLCVAEDNVGAVIIESTVASTAIQAALDHKVGKTLCLDGEYEIATAISIPSLRTLEGESYKTIFEQPSPPIGELIKNDYSAGATNFQIKNLTLDGKSRGVDWKHGIWLQNVSSFNIENIHGLNFTGSVATYARNSLLVIGSESIASRIGTYGSIHNIVADNVRGDVVYLTGKESQTEFSKYVNIYDIIGKNTTGNIVDINEVKYCNISDIAGYNTGGCDVLTDGSHYCNIKNITSYTPKTGLKIGHHAPGTTGVSSHNTVSNIICYHPSQYGISVLNSSDNVISNFQVIGSAETGAGLVFVEAVGAGTTDEGVCKGNKFTNGIITSPNNHGFYIYESTGSDDATYTECTNVHVLKTSGTAKQGFYVQADRATFVGCTAKGASLSNGFYFYGANNCILNGCTATGCAGYGVLGASADYLLLVSNSLTGNTSGSTSGLGGNSKAPADSNFL